MIRLFNVSVPIGLLVLLIGDALAATACYITAGLFALNSALDPWFYFRYEGGWTQVLLAVAVLQLGLYFLDLYDLRLQSQTHLIQQLCIALGFSFIVQALVGYGESTTLQLPQWTMMYGSLLVLLVVPSWRALYVRFVGKTLPSQRVLMLGVSPAGAEVMKVVKERPEFRVNVMGYLDWEPKSPHAKYLGEPSADQLNRTVRDLKPDLIVVCRTEVDPLPIETLTDLCMEGANVEAIGSLYEEVFGRVAVRSLQPQDFVFSKELRPRPWTIRLQSVYSFLGGLVGLVIALPIMLVVAILVRLTSAGPAIYSQERVGLNGRRFRIYKFRSMYQDAEKKTGPVWATKHDPRITPLGRWLRKLRLDELPQLMNVLTGSMVLVGPRPERPEFCQMLNQQIPYFHKRHSVKPGITGWAQINHRYADTLEDTITKLEYDLYYVKNVGPALDAYVIFHTLKVMLLSRGAQ
jgi:exopolysaccharide biosynthesis polyprenyl glycosylphosphotransferase